MDIFVPVGTVVAPSVDAESGHTILKIGDILVDLGQCSVTCEKD
jgi:hypothetical protein